MKIKATHLTSAHPRYDTRIFIKQCQSLFNAGYEVNLVVADGKGDEKKNGTTIYDVGRLSGRINRILKTTKKIYKKALALDSDVYHIHDPELMPIGLKLLSKGKRVIFDAHEDLPKQILSKPYLKPWQTKPLSWLVEKYESYALSKFSGIVAATPFIQKKFLKINKKTENINNYPDINEFLISAKTQNNHSKSVCYVGSLSKVRGIKEIVESMALVESNIQLKIAGTFSEDDFEFEIKRLKGWDSVQELGFLDREGISETLSNSIAGLVTLHPIVNYLDALPVKMFEYMASGLPVISSNIPLWENIIDSNQCGICVNPMSPQEIATAINFLVENPEKAKEMGKNGKEAILKKYNWNIEERKLIAFYENITQVKI